MQSNRQPGPRLPLNSAMVLLTALVISVAYGRQARAFDDQLELGVEGGYSQLTRRASSSPPLTFGGGGGIRLRYGLTDWLGVSFSGRMTWYAAYRPSIKTTVADPEDPEAEPIPTTVYGERIERIHVRGFTFSLLYAFDVMRVVPFFALGVVSARISEERDKIEVVDHELGLRTDLGADYAVLDHLSIGATIGADTFLTNRSAYVSQFDVVIRVSFLWDVGILGRPASPQ